MPMTSMWSRWGGLHNKKRMEGGVTHEATTAFVSKSHVSKAPDAISFGLFPLGKDPSLRILCALVKEGRQTLNTISNCKKHG